MYGVRKKTDGASRTRQKQIPDYEIGDFGQRSSYFPLIIQLYAVSSRFFGNKVRRAFCPFSQFGFPKRQESPDLL